VNNRRNTFFQLGKNSIVPPNVISNFPDVKGFDWFNDIG
jgi:hypothetical protein